MTTSVVFPPPAARRRRPRWLPWVVAGWAAIVVAIALYSVNHFVPTARDQTTIAHALPTVDTAVAQVVAAAAGDPAVPAITGYVTVDRSCRVTSVRDGARYQRWVRLFTAAGAEGALLDRLAAGLPREYAAYLSHPATGPVLHAIAGNFVDLTGGILAPGQVRVVADTGCRPQDRPVVERGLDNPPDRGPVETVLTALGVQATRWETHRVTCPAGGAVWTVEADGGADGGQARSPLDALKEASPVLARPEAYAYRSGPVGVAVRTEAGTVTVTATTTCQ